MRKQQKGWLAGLAVSAGLGLWALSGWTVGEESRGNTTISPKREADIKRVVALLEPATKIDPENAELFSILGMLYQRLGQVDPAEQALEKTASLEPGNIGARFMLAMVYEKKGKTELAIREWRVVEKEAPYPHMKTTAERHLKLLQPQP